jgi:hypothetical protein
VINKLLTDKPAARGLVVPGMPIGSPGMEVPGRAPDRYDVLLLARDGTTRVFARREGLKALPMSGRSGDDGE